MLMSICIPRREDFFFPFLSLVFLTSVSLFEEYRNRIQPNKFQHKMNNSSTLHPFVLKRNS